MCCAGCKGGARVGSNSDLQLAVPHVKDLQPLKGSEPQDVLKGISSGVELAHALRMVINHFGKALEGAGQRFALRFTRRQHCAWPGRFSKISRRGRTFKNAGHTPRGSSSSQIVSPLRFNEVELRVTVTDSPK